MKRMQKLTPLGAQYKLAHAARLLRNRNGGESCVDGHWDVIWKDEADRQAEAILIRLRDQIWRERRSR